MNESGAIQGERLRQLRLTRGLSLDDLVEVMGGIVTKQSLSKYERNLTSPSPEVEAILAKALGVNSERLRTVPAVEVIAFRRLTRLGGREQERIEGLVRFVLEERARVQHLLGEATAELPFKRYRVTSPEEAEAAAERLRQEWGLGSAPIANVVELLEEHGVHVIEIDAEDDFDGVAVVAKDASGRPAALAVVTRRGVPGERQRLNLTHELAHLVMDLPDGTPPKEEEALAFRFGSAFIAPRSTLLRAIGQRRNYISAQELLLLKGCFGMSVQALLMRLHKLGVINAESYKKWCIILNKLKWRKAEPEPWEPEQPTWLVRSVLRAVSEGALAEDDARTVLVTELGASAITTLLDKRRFVSMATTEGAKVVERQVEEMTVRFRSTHRR
jgi:Zn-dependent peptidase ImmA (M78 family)